MTSTLTPAALRSYDYHTEHQHDCPACGDVVDCFDIAEDDPCDWAGVCCDSTRDDVDQD